MAKNNREGGYNSSNSPELGRKISENIPTDIMEKIKFLRQCGVEEGYLEIFAGVSGEFSDRLVNVLGEQPSPEEIGVVNAYLSTELDTPRKKFNKLSFIEYHTLRVRGAVMDAANDDLFGGGAANDEDYPLTA